MPCGIRHLWTPASRSRRHPTGSRALTQPRQHLEAGVTVGRLHADLLLEGEDGLDRVAAGAAIDAVGLETAFIETALDFHDLRQRRHALAVGEQLVERRGATNEVASMDPA